jgi:hypothetical protein
MQPAGKELKAAGFEMRTLRWLLAFAGILVALVALTMLFVRSVVQTANRQQLLVSPPAPVVRKVKPVLFEEMPLCTWLDRCGPPDSIVSSDVLKPRPRVPARMLHYKEQGFRALFMCGYHQSDDKLPPYEEWQLESCFDDNETASFFEGWDGSEPEWLWEESERGENARFFRFPCTAMFLDHVAERMAK